jgi:hypothetical protein
MICPMCKHRIACDWTNEEALNIRDEIAEERADMARRHEKGEDITDGLERVRTLTAQSRDLSAELRKKVEACQTI